ncbi:antitoxin [Hydrogenovibrio thermophilus]|uniref:Antitoxin n=2 Tax=Hydrogenovibrio thermophilus TaxID=265883 RepID=A0A410H282_9GAMM|nr:antitoxin [Hydrogenovibrio thermophilus]
MMEARIFQSGNSQAVRIPKEFRFDVTEVEIFKRGDEIVLKPKPKNLGAAFKLLGEMPDDFMVDGREDTLPQERESF